MHRYSGGQKPSPFGLILLLLQADVQQMLLSEEELPPEQQKRSPFLHYKDFKTPNIKEEQEELWISQEGEQLQGLEEADTTFNIVSVKIEDDEEQPGFSRLLQTQTEWMDSGTDVEDCGEEEPVRDSDSERHLQPETGVRTEDPSEPETEDGEDDWKETTEHQSGENFGDKSPKDDGKTHSCPECGTTFKRKRDVTRHMRKHTGEKPFSCSVCGMRFTQKGSLSSHMRIHTGEKLFSCSECDKKFTQRASLTEHMRIHTGEKPFSCSECDKRFTRKGSLTQHMRVHTGEKPYSCCFCGKLFNNTGRLSSHMRIHTGEKPFSCSECGKRFHQNQQLNSHMRVHTGEKPFCCSKCDRKFTNKVSLDVHMRFHTGEKPFSCTECNKRFPSKRYLNRHLVKHKGEVIYSCSVCLQRFPSYFLLDKHKCVGDQDSEPQNQDEIRRAAEPGADEGGHGGAEAARNSDPHNQGTVQPETVVKIEESSGTDTEDSEEYLKETKEKQSGLNSVGDNVDKSQKAGKKLLSCSECEKKFKFNYDLTRHMRMHTGEKPFSCSLCGKTFKFKYNLTTHLRIHTGEKPFSCSECGKRFTQKGSLDLHMKIHTGEKLFGCNECGKSFNEKGKLRSHMLVHTGEKPFSCSECGKSFTLKSYLARHLAWHRGEKRYCCNTCDQTFSWHYQLKNHKCLGGQSSHQVQVEEPRETGTGAEGEYFGGAEPAWNSDPENLLVTEVKIEDSSGPETEENGDYWMDTREHQSGLNPEIYRSPC